MRALLLVFPAMKVLFLLFSLFFSPLTQAGATPIGAAGMPPVPVLEARAYLLYDVTSNQILVNQNGTERMEPASLTKMMTAYLAFSALRQKTLIQEQQITPSADAVKPQGEESRMFLESNKSATVGELLRGLIVQSGNDAARVLAETISGSEAAFAERMNREAQRLGLRNTHFVNATGLPAPQHYSSAYDMAMLAAAIIRDFPEFYSIYSQREFSYNGITQPNRNRLLWMDPFVDGLKTGHTSSAGFCLVSSARRGERRLISVVLGTDSDTARAVESQKLLNHGFQDFEAVRLYARGQPVSEVRVWKGTEKMLPVGFRQEMYVSVPRGMKAQLQARIEMQHPLIAPIGLGQRVGTLKLSLNGKPYFDYPLLAQQAVPVANVFSRGWDTLRLFFE
jgi:D-alanyl-D-alanine carboxypeptidase (penicillin-binding protein 5/6)